MGIITFGSLSISFSSSSHSLCFSRTGPRGVNLWVRRGTGNFLVGCPLAGVAVRLPYSRPKVGGFVGLVVRAWGLVVQLT